MKDLFKISKDKYVLDDSSYADIKGTLVTYREWIDGTPFTITSEGFETTKQKGKVEQLMKDLKENITENLNIEGVVAKDGTLFVLNCDFGPQPKVYETFYPWAPHEFLENLEKLEGHNKPIDGLELVVSPTDRRIVRRNMF